MTTFFDFEQDFVDSLRCIPMIVRYKLDTCGVKLKLDRWFAFDRNEKELLVKNPCQTPTEIEEYRHNLQELVFSQTGEYAKELTIDPHPAWLNREQIPEIVRQKAKEFDLQLTLPQWQSLNDLQRFALIKLSRSKHENKNFLPALKEFNLVD